MSPPPKTVEFWYDFASADSHPVAQVIGRRAADAGVVVAWKPFRSAPVVRRREAHDAAPPLDEEARADYWRQFTHTCELAGVPGLRPSHHPRDPIPALRAALACEAEGLDAPTFVRAAFDAGYVRDWDIGDVSVLGEVLVEIDYDAARVLARARDLAVRAQLDANTAEALRREFNDAPTVVTPDGDLHWGYDGLAGALRAASAP